MSRIQLFGEFLLKNHVITSSQLLDALSFQKEIMRMQSILQLLGNTLSPEEYNTIMEKLEEGQSVERLALETGALSSNEIHEIRLNKEFRLPLGEVLIRKEYIDPETLQRWLHAFANQEQDQPELMRLLTRSAFFGAIPEEELPAIVSNFKYKYYPAGERIYGQGDESNGLYFIESGLVATRVRAGNSQREANRFRSLECFGLEGLLSGSVRTENAYATMDTAAWRLDGATFHNLLKKHPDLAIRAARQLSERMTDLLHEGARHREPNVFALFADMESDASRNLAAKVISEFCALCSKRIQFLSVSDFFPEEEILMLSGDRQGVFALQAPGLAEAADWNGLLRWLHSESDQIDQLVLLADVRSATFAELSIPNASRTVSIVEKYRPEYLASVRKGKDRIYVLSGGDSDTIRQSVPDDAKPYAVLRGDGEKRGSNDLPGLPHQISSFLLRRLVGFAFGGGGARGLAHVGSLQVLAGHGIVPNEVAGTSVGSIVAAAASMGYTAEEIRKFFVEYALESKSHPFLDYTIPFESLASGGRLKRMLQSVFANDRIDATPLPCYAVATDMHRGSAFLPRQSALWASVKASCTLPGILPLVELEGRHLGDGGMVNNIPSDILRNSGCDLIVSFNITPELGANKFNPKSLMGVLSQTLDIAVEKGGEGHLLHADLEVQPSVAGFGTADFSGGYRLMELGAEAMEKKLGQLRRLLDRLHSQTAY